MRANDLIISLTRWKSALADRKTWSNFAYLITPAILIGCLYLSTSRSLIHTWNDTENLTYTHGWLIAAISVWLLFQVSKSISLISIQPVPLALLCYGALSFLWLLAHQMNIQIAQQCLLPLLAFSAVWGLFGTRVARRCAFVFGYLYFAIPIWDHLTALLQWGTVFAVRTWVRAFGIPAFFDGYTVHLPAGVFAVEGGCSGLHYVIVALALAALYGYLHAIKNKFRLLMLAGSLAILANWIRVFIIVVAGHLTNMQHYLVRVEHYRFGWVVFAIMMWAFFYLAGRMTSQSANALSDTAPLQNGTTRAFNGIGSISALLVLLAIPTWTVAIENRNILPIVSANILTLPPGWVESNASTAGWQPVFLNADAQRLTQLQKQDFNVNFYHAVFNIQRQDKKLAGYYNTVVGDRSATVRSVTVVKNDGRFIETHLANAAGHDAVIWHSYYVDGRWFNSALRAQVWYGLRSLFVAQVSGVIAVRADCIPDCPATRIKLLELTKNWQLEEHLIN